jgi:hypothetical protein
MRPRRDNEFVILSPKRNGALRQDKAVGSISHVVSKLVAWVEAPALRLGVRNNRAPKPQGGASPFLFPTVPL